MKITNLDGFIERLYELNRTLESIQNELKNYLEKKRELFGRFYFLSNEDLISILSLTKDPSLVQIHLKKIFENIDRIQLNSE